MWVCACVCAHLFVHLCVMESCHVSHWGGLCDVCTCVCMRVCVFICVFVCEDGKSSCFAFGWCMSVCMCVCFFICILVCEDGKSHLGGV